MNKVKENVVEQLEEIEKQDKEFFDHIKFENHVANILWITRRCIKDNCPYYGNILYKGLKWHLCYDTWSVSKNGWSAIYGETIDLCVDTE